MIMFVLSICNLVVNTARPRFTRSNFWTLVPAISVHFFISDAVKEKVVFVIAVGIIFILMNIYNIFDRVFGEEIMVSYC